MALFGKKQNAKALDKNVMKADVIEKCQEIYDPEIPVNIYDLGLIYEVIIHDDASVKVNMTLTTPGCPVAQYFPSTVQMKVMEVEGVKDVEVELVWDPPWEQNMMSDACKLELGLL